jgi:Putative peptidoglycan binding domain
MNDTVEDSSQPADMTRRLAQIERRLETLSSRKKDIWERLTSLSPFVSGVLIAGVGLYFTVTSQRRQIEINEADLAIKFFPHISSRDEQVRTQAFSVIQAVGGDLLIAKLAPVGGNAIEPALAIAQRTAVGETRAAVSQALSDIRTVREIQTKLGLVPDGEYGPMTRDRIMRVQRENGLEATGVLDERTINLIRQAPAGAR